MSKKNKKAIWCPSSEQIHASQMFQFMQHINQKYGTHLENYASLYEWSIQNIKEFWSEIWAFCGVISRKSWNEILVNSEKMSESQWFTGAELNFAENLLRHSKENKTAIIFYNEKKYRREISYPQLYLMVAQFASALRKAGVKANDRVAAFMPNLPETLIAMLATASIGAIWSSCSPDFGIQGVYDRFSQIQPKILLSADGYFYNINRYDCLEKVRTLQEKIPSIEKIIVVPYLHENPDLSSLQKAVFYDDFIDKNATEINFTSLPFNHPIYILYSSGTTGVPKCIVHGIGGTLLQHLKELMLHTDLKMQDTIFYYTTCGWMMWNWFVSSLAVGATLVLYDGSPFHPKSNILFDLIDKEKITIFGTSAKYISAVEKAKLHPKKKYKLSRLRTILSTGSPLLAANYDFVYKHIKKNVCLSSISGGTDIVSCFALGNPMLPVYSGELQCRGLGMKVEIFDENGHSVREQKGELVCTAPFPAMPIYFWNDPNNEKYHKTYFAKFPNVWTHGDYAELTQHDGIIIYGRSDTILNPGGVRIGTAEIYRQVETIDDILESVVIGQDWNGDVRVVLFVKLHEGINLTEELKNKLKMTIRKNASPHHVPSKIIQVSDIPRTINGKIAELAVRDVVHGRVVKNVDALANPEALENFKDIKELKS
jgi:acetoacetyl-CoA synthetase